jgi:hypothetical protein
LARVNEAMAIAVHSDKATNAFGIRLERQSKKQANASVAIRSASIDPVGCIQCPSSEVRRKTATNTRRATKVNLIHLVRPNALPLALPPAFAAPLEFAFPLPTNPGAEPVWPGALADLPGDPDTEAFATALGVANSEGSESPKPRAPAKTSTTISETSNAYSIIAAPTCNAGFTSAKHLNRMGSRIRSPVDGPRRKQWQKTTKQ